MKISARTSEIQTLETALKSEKPEFMAIYGRRRVGKTYLVREFFRQNPDLFYFESTGQKNASLNH
jgi:AAA+ ATPase superfamily predicted ATPase